MVVVVVVQMEHPVVLVEDPKQGPAVSTGNTPTVSPPQGNPSGAAAGGNRGSGGGGAAFAG